MNARPGRIEGVGNGRRDGGSAFEHLKHDEFLLSEDAKFQCASGLADGVNPAIYDMSADLEKLIGVSENGLQVGLPMKLDGYTLRLKLRAREVDGGLGESAEIDTVSLSG